MKPFIVYNLPLSGFLLLFFLCFSGCQSYESSIPDTPVYIKRNILNEKDLIGLGNALYINVPKLASDRIGYGGILIVHALNDNFYAFDLACPVEADRNVKIGKPNQALICKCDSCGEEYDVSGGRGFPIKHLSKEVLRPYKVRIDTYTNDIEVYR